MELSQIGPELTYVLRYHGRESRPPWHLLAECVGTNTGDSLVSWLDPGEEAGDIQFSDS